MDKEFVVLTAMHWLAVLLYVIATIATTWGIIFQRAKAERAAYYPVLVGLLIHGLAIGFWWRAVGHGPYIARYEILSAMSWVMLAIFLLFGRVFPLVRPASILVYPTALLLIGLAIFCNPAVKALPPTFRGIWLVLHVSFYIIALPTILIALALSLGNVLKARTAYPWLVRLPEPEDLDLLAYRFAGFGFVFWSIAMLTGAIWAYQAWGRFWGWDPIETWSLVTWGGFGIYLHLRRFFNLAGERAAAFFIVCFVLAVVALFFVPLLESSVHSEYFR